MKKIHPCFVMPFLMVGISLGLLLSSGCKSQAGQTNPGTNSNEMNASVAATAVADPGLHFIKTELYPDGTWKELSEANRRYSLDSFYLDHTGSLSYLLAVPTMNHCGSGGCRFWVLDSNGNLLSTTSVADFPITVSKRCTMGWYDLMTWSNGKHRVLAWDGYSYASNASVAGEISEEDRKALTQGEVLLNPIQEFVEF